MRRIAKCGYAGVCAHNSPRLCRICVLLGTGVRDAYLHSRHSPEALRALMATKPGKVLKYIMTKDYDLESIADICRTLADIAMNCDVAIVTAEQRRSASNTMVFNISKSRAPRPGRPAVKINFKKGLRNYES